MKKPSIQTSIIVFICFFTGFIVCYLTIPVKQLVTTQNFYDTNFELGMVKEDLQTYGRSSIFIKVVVPAIDKASEKYKIPIGLLHAIFRVESDYRPQLDHDRVTVSVRGQSITTNAIGLGGMMWVYWGDSLKAQGIAETEMDLYFPHVAIEASAYVLRYMIDTEIKNNKNLTSFNILSNVIRSYFGAYSSTYLAKMQLYTSDLWMKRMAKEVYNLVRLDSTKIK